MSPEKRRARARRKAKANRLERWQHVPMWKSGNTKVKLT